MDNKIERKGNTNKGDSRNRRGNAKKSKSDLQAIQRHRRDSQVREIAENGIKHIVGRVNHPQTNGKIERFFGTLEAKIKYFDTVVHRVV